MAVERCYAVEPDEIYHASCYSKQYPSDEKQPEFVEVEPRSDDECDYCGGAMIDPPESDEDDFDDDDEGDVVDVDEE